MVCGDRDNRKLAFAWIEQLKRESIQNSMYDIVFTREDDDNDDDEKGN